MSEIEITAEDREAAAAYEIGRAPESGHVRVLAQAFARHRLAARERAIEEAAKVADARAQHAERLMLNDDTGVTDARVAFQMASELVSKDIRALNQQHKG